MACGRRRTSTRSSDSSREVRWRRVSDAAAALRPHASHTTPHHHHHRLRRRRQARGARRRHHSEVLRRDVLLVDPAIHQPARGAKLRRRPLRLPRRRQEGGHLGRRPPGRAVHAAADQWRRGALLPLHPAPGADDLGEREAVAAVHRPHGRLLQADRADLPEGPPRPVQGARRPRPPAQRRCPRREAAGGQVQRDRAADLALWRLGRRRHARGGGGAQGGARGRPPLRSVQRVLAERGRARQPGRQRLPAVRRAARLRPRDGRLREVRACAARRRDR